MPVVTGRNFRVADNPETYAVTERIFLIGNSYE